MPTQTMILNVIKQLVFGLALTIGLIPFKNSFKDILFIAFENCLVIGGIFDSLLVNRNPIPTLLGYLLIYMHISLVFIDMNILLWMGTTLNNNMMQNIFESQQVGKSLTDENWTMVYILIILAFLPQAFVYYIKYQQTGPRKSQYSRIPESESTSEQKGEISKVGLCLIYLLFLCGNAYSPISNALVATLMYSKEGSIQFDSSANATFGDLLETPSTNDTNLVYIMNESMGNYYLMDPHGNYNNVTFFKNNISDSPGTVYNFRNTRSISGNTETAMVTLSTGLFIASNTHSEETRNFFKVPSLMSEAKKRGYQTALYCAFETHFDVGWKQLNAVYEQFEHVVSRTTLGLDAVNDHGIDDRIITEKALNYLKEKSNSTQPFFLVIIWNNLHFPFLVDESFKKPVGVSPDELEIKRANYSLGITDSMLESVVSTIKQSHFGNKTVIAFAADHGEQPGMVHDRISNAASSVLSVPLWFDIPDYLLSKSEKDNLSVNAQHRLTSTMDIVPTLMDIMKWQDPLTVFKDSKSTVHGQSLLKSVEANRYTYGWAGKPFVTTCDWTIGFFFNSTHNLMVYSKNNIQLERVEYPNYAYKKDRIPFLELPPADQAIWKREIKKHSHVYEQMKLCGLTIV
ncbi:hypothetical protein HK103_001682 [Boothiomyces macroporosus]|uniref:Sulfatase N-terminal domain-containing protein n=1 Tax=Boothiomyces macroporosus TaxID=261099 RepID=A0AAD5UJM6_9FUNG|nr:hypothetical protein HK103_001682 [Boothiomyces macroporosus]